MRKDHCVIADEKREFEAYSYRTSSRFGSRVEVRVDGETVTVAGPRVGVLLYRMWIVVQVILLALIIPALLMAVIFWEGAAVATFDRGGQPTTSFPLTAVKRVRVGRG